MEILKRGLIVMLGLSLLYGLFPTSIKTIESTSADSESILADTWPQRIRQWEAEIAEAAEKYELDPDLIASVILAESDGDSNATSYVGAVGLMGIMPKGPGFGYRPEAIELYNPMTNITWGSAILSDILQQSAGDVHASLAAYNGGWQYATYPVPKQYAADVLNGYGRAIASRHGINPNVAVQWTIAVDMRNGYISGNDLVAGTETIDSNAPRYQGGTFSNEADGDDRAYSVVVYAIPLDKEIEIDKTFVKLAVH